LEKQAVIEALGKIYEKEFYDVEVSRPPGRVRTKG